MSPDELLALGMILAFMVFLLIGMPVGIGIALAGFLFGWMGFGDFLFNLSPARIYGVVTKYEFLAIPLFVYMGVMLEKSRVAEDMLEVVGYLSGKMNGGMAIALIVVGVLMGASTGIVGATVVTLTMLTMPVLLKRGYDGGVAAGTICASGTLGQIIPPSLVLILLADIMGESVGTLFAAALLPGVMLSILYVAYIYGLGRMRPAMLPPIPAEERAALTGVTLALKAVKALAPPLLLVGGVLGSIIGGLAAPTEAAGVGAILAVLIALIYGRLTIRMIWAASESALRISAMIFFILVAAQVFSIAFRGLDGEDLVKDTLAFIPGGETGALLFLMLLLFILGFFLEWIEISYIALPLLLPFFRDSGTDMVWLAALIALNLQTSFLTPPFGWALFFLKGAAPPQITTGMIYRGILPFIAIQLVALSLLFMVPGIATWLPEAIGW
ncbi:MAG: TRAP transporter large permease subunit [Pseudomonadota bacterium]